VRSRLEAGSVHALVPLKRLAYAKTRLEGILTPPERAGLMHAMLADVLTALESVPEVGRVTLVSSEPAAEPLAARHEVAFWHDRGLPWNEALTAATAAVVSEPVAAIVSADVPLATAYDLSALVRSVPPRGIAIARALDGGTNAVVLAPPGAVDTCFGTPASADRHARIAARAGLDAVVVDRPALALDLDSEADVARFLASDRAGAHTRRFLGGLRSFSASADVLRPRVVA
jgi:2-phospho-L-lactate guanylyltransferase